MAMSGRRQDFGHQSAQLVVTCVQLYISQGYMGSNTWVAALPAVSRKVPAGPDRVFAWLVGASSLDGGLA
eukprot:15448451-Alexandrium_andersonii.AAC.1